MDEIRNRLGAIRYTAENLRGTGVGLKACMVSSDKEQVKSREDSGESGPGATTRLRALHGKWPASIAGIRFFGNSAITASFDSPTFATNSFASQLRQRKAWRVKATASLTSQETPHFSMFIEAWNGRRSFHVREGSSVMVPAQSLELVPLRD